MYNNDTEKLFAEGGMKDEGGTVDPVSGNDVPVGSLQNEVRDDIPAKLSEGEFVIPADVVRYIGLERLMKLRDEAKQGLNRMDEIGQMGNADQVDNPEELHGDKFSSEIDNIISEVDSEDGEQNFAAGGVVKVPEASKDILAKYNIQRTAITNPANDVRLLKNAAGDSLYMTYFNGKPSGRIPEGYSVTDANPASRLTGTKTTSTATGVSNPTGVVSGTVGGKIGDNVITSTSIPTNIPIVDTNTATTTTSTSATKPDDTVSSTAPNAGFIGDRGQGVNSYGGSITATDTGAVSTGVGGFTLNPDGSVTANTVDKATMLVAGFVNPFLGIAARVNNSFATSSAKDFTASIADTGGTNINPNTSAATAGPTSVGGTGGTAATAAALAASDASSKGMSDAAIGAASQAAAAAIVKGGSASDAAQAGSEAARSQANYESEVTQPTDTQPQTVSTVNTTDTTTNVQPKETPIGNIDTTVGSGNDGGDNGAGDGGISGGGSGGEAGGDIGGSTDVGGDTGSSSAGEFTSTGSMTAVDGFGGSFAAKPMEKLSAGVEEMAKGGLVSKRVKKITSAQKIGIASRK